MKNYLIVILLAILFILPIKPVPGQASSENRSKYKAAYYGKQGGAREKEFSSFLSAHFTNIKYGNLSGFTEADAQDADIIFLDIFDIDERIKSPQFSQGFNKPVFVIGAGDMIFSPILKEAKTGGYM